MNLITHNVNKVMIAQRVVDGYINLTAMAKANDKLIADYLRLETTKAFLQELSQSMGIPIVDLVRIKTGRGGGTWGHPQVAINCGQWCSPSFAVLVSQWVFDWMRKGKTPAIAQPVVSSRERELQLELELIRAKQHYQDTGYAIALSTSPAMLQWLRGETPPPPKIEYRDRFVDPTTGQEIGSSSGRSLTQVIADAGLNPKSTRDRNRVKKILKCCGFDYDKMQRWVSASYLREYPVLEEEVYQQALKAVLAGVAEFQPQPNLFVHSLEQATLAPDSIPHHLPKKES
ncbi:MAG: hypothetical protein CLLPBCKN_006160 [Chroococcidiopsis cubana SAG 39.79]|uniref:KilA-N domain-containing protein n=1 Tax=Chroococcidiopsis cubana SAG 39.79 TaxID=388085 RepID=A0AB37UGC1_9CYAN|nr:KilA-N domain-containing protein [Chroococcidiopsis cubana]MDZ4876725.1 hypothetical protein [Chroococcidiopsis cubana SAG 39.79]PSB65940.1 hypothetical protein C7B79_03130 [Chroococcidiopsis cubana CCALA 043]RUT10568.1 hypothetical protein DSM107010_41350 [Chroococcidiopsis cubana SAG 39.79]